MQYGDVTIYIMQNGGSECRSLYTAWMKVVYHLSQEGTKKGEETYFRTESTDQLLAVKCMGQVIPTFIIVVTNYLSTRSDTAGDVPTG